MSKVNIIRAWKDEEYRRSLSAAERALLPDNPVGLSELTDADLQQTAGGRINLSNISACLACHFTYNCRPIYLSAQCPA